MWSRPRSFRCSNRQRRNCQERHRRKRARRSLRALFVCQDGISRNGCGETCRLHHAIARILGSTGCQPVGLGRRAETDTLHGVRCARFRRQSTNTRGELRYPIRTACVLSKRRTWSVRSATSAFGSVSFSPSSWTLPCLISRLASARDLLTLNMSA